MSTFISFLTLKKESWTMQDELLLSLLSPSRQVNVMNYTYEVDKRLSLYSVLLLSHMLQTHFHITDGLQDIHWTRGKKPFLASFPHIDFNYSHTRKAILCGVSSDGNIGIDLEHCHKAPFEIMTSAFHPNEINYVKSFPSLEREHAFFEIWTRKEAYTKEKGTGLICDLTSINTLSAPNAFFQKWEQDSYICTACQESRYPTTFQIVDEEIFISYTPHSKLCF